MKLAWAFFKRDALIAISYHTAFAVQLLGNIVILGVFYFVGRTLAGAEIPALARYGGSYLAFLLIGVALTDCVGVSLTSFAKQIREGQLTGSLEATLMSPLPLPVILLLSSLWAYSFSAFRFLLYLALGTALYGVDLGHANLKAALLLFALTVLCFAGIGMLWASVVMVIKQGDPIITVGGFAVVLLSGVLFPSSVLPGWLQKAAALVPLTHSLEGMRLALLNGYGVRELGGIVGLLCVFAVVCLASGLIAFSWSVSLAKRTGSLAHY
jgi:ABC-2 type transport system permease protein